MEKYQEHYIENGIHFYHGEPDVPSFVVHHHLTDDEAKEISKHITRLKRNTRRRERYAKKKQESLIEKRTTKSEQMVSNIGKLQPA